MAIWRYDGSFTGFLTLCAALLSQGEEPEEIISAEPLQNDLFRTIISVASDENRGEKMLAAIASRISPDSCRLLWQAFLSEAPGVELLLWRYLSFGRTTGVKCDRFLAHPAVGPVHRLANSVGQEAHRLMGIIRFQETAGGQWYALVEPAYQVLELIAPHFAARCSDMNWLIHDRRRSLAVAWNKQEWRLTRFDAQGVPPCRQARRHGQRSGEDILPQSPSRNGLIFVSSNSTSRTASESISRNWRNRLVADLHPPLFAIPPRLGTALVNTLDNPPAIYSLTVTPCFIMMAC